MSGYQRIAAELARRIAGGEFPVGGRLPTEQRLTEEYGVARGTVRRALESLARQGVVAARQGSGWLITSSLSTQNFGELRSFAQWARSKGRVPSGRVVASEPGTPTVHDIRMLRLEHAAPVLRVTRLRFLDDEVAMLERTTYAPWVAEHVAALPPDEPSVVAALRDRFGVATKFATHRIDAIAASSEDARLLGVRRASPLMRVRRDSSAPDGRVIEWGDDRYLPGTISFQVHTSATGERFTRTLG